LSLDDRQRSAFVQLVELAEDLGALAVRQRAEGRLVPVARSIRMSGALASGSLSLRLTVARFPERRVSTGFASMNSARCRMMSSAKPVGPPTWARTVSSSFARRSAAAARR